MFHTLRWSDGGVKYYQAIPKLQPVRGAWNVSSCGGEGQVEHYSISTQIKGILDVFFLFWLDGHQP